MQSNGSIAYSLPHGRCESIFLEGALDPWAGFWVDTLVVSFFLKKASITHSICFHEEDKLWQCMWTYEKDSAEVSL